MTDQEFVLESRPAPPKVARPADDLAPKQRQGKLFSGLNLLPG